MWKEGAFDEWTKKTVVQRSLRMRYDPTEKSEYALYLNWFGNMKTEPWAEDEVDNNEP